VTPAKPPAVSPGEDTPEAGAEEEPEEISPVPRLSNPLSPAGNTLDDLIKTRINDDVWRSLKGNLPCVDASAICIFQLQAMSISNSPILAEIDARTSDIQSRIDEARKLNKKTVTFELIEPLARDILSKPSPLTELANIVISPFQGVNRILAAIGIPIFSNLFGGSRPAQQQAISIADLQVKLSEIQRGRAAIADQIKQNVVLYTVDFEESAREFQIAQEIAIRNSWRSQYIRLGYENGQGDTATYLNELSSIDREKAQIFRVWSQMRSRLLKMKLLVLGTKTD